MAAASVASPSSASSTMSPSSSSVDVQQMYTNVRHSLSQHFTPTNRAKLQALAERVRPLPVFFRAQAFSKPASFAEATARFDQNLRFFAVNYALLSLLILAFVIITHPIFLLTLLVLVGLWLFALSRDTVTLYPTTVSLTGQPKLITFGVVSALLLFMFAGDTLFICLGISCVVTAAHGMLRTPPTPDELAESESLMEMGGTSAV